MNNTAITNAITSKARLTLRAVSVLCAVASLFSTAQVFAQAAPATPPPAPPVATAPAPAPEPAPVVVAPPPAAPEVIAPAPMPAPEPMPMAEPMPVEPPPPPPPADDPTKKPIDVHAWSHGGLTLHGANNPKKLDRLTADGDLELHFDGAITDMIGLTANVAAVYPNAADTIAPTGRVAILDLISRFDIMDAFHIWVGRMLVPVDRANFSGHWFAAPWSYPGLAANPHEGPYGRNDGATIWGQAAGGLFKYYVGAFDLSQPAGKVLWTGRLNLALINPEPGYYHSSTYYGGKDILAIGIGAQFKKAGEMSGKDYGEFNVDVLYEQNFHEGGVLDLEGGFYKFTADTDPAKYSYLLLASWLTPEKVGIGKIQPLVRLQQLKPNGGAPTDTKIDFQAGYAIADYAARLALVYTYEKNGPTKSNAITLGVQLLK